MICNPKDLKMYKTLLGNGEKFKVNITYKTQKYPKGIADAFRIGEKFIGNDTVALILGDNFLYGENISNIMLTASQITKGALIFGYTSDNPSAFAVVDINNRGEIIDIQEKPESPKSNIIIPGIYFYDNSVVNISKNIIPSKRGELEITDINKIYLEKKLLNIVMLDHKTMWWDLGTIDAILDASIWVKHNQIENKKLIANIYDNT